MKLPEGLASRTLTVADVDDVVAMVNRCELADIGETMWERADLLSDISTGTFDVRRDWLGVFDGGAPVAWAMVERPARAFVDVDPGHRARGVGTALRTWTEERARAMGLERIAQVIEDRRTDVTGMLDRAGYRAGPNEPAPAEPPDDIRIRAFAPADETELLQMFEDAFMEFEGRSPSTLQAWRAMTVEREGFRPQDMPVALDGDRIVGGAFLIEADAGIWVDKFAVQRDYRHRGIARALLRTAFLRSWELGSSRTELSTDSRTGALSFYERIGMYVRTSYTNWSLAL
jgi:mycothiol synthase